MGSVIITGASRGIGFAIADIFAENGFPLTLTSRNPEKLASAQQKLAAKYPNLEINSKAFDLSIKKEAIDFGNWCIQHSTPAVLINNAGSFTPGNIGSEPDGVLENQLATNLFSAYHVTRAILPAMLQNAIGHIFNICSIASLHAYANGGSYSISKFALYGFSKNLREELKPYNIKVTAVMPGAVLTDSWGGFDNSGNRIMEARDIAKLIFTTSQLSPAACVEDIVLRPQLGDL